MTGWILFVLILILAAIAAGVILLDQIRAALALLSGNVDRLITQQAGSIPAAGVQALVDDIGAINAKVEGAIVP